MYSRHQQNLIRRTGALGEVPRRRLLQSAGALSLATILRPTAAFAESDDESERLGPFGPWSTPVNLGPVINSSSDDRFPVISRNGLSLYITSDRPDGVIGGKFLELWVSQRVDREADWEPPRNLGQVINSTIGNTSAPTFSPDGHLMYFGSIRAGGCGGPDLWVSRRENKRDDFGWQEPVNLACTINTSHVEAEPAYFEDEETGVITLYFRSDRDRGVLGDPGDIYVSTLGDDGSWGPGIFVPELSSYPFLDSRTAIRRDGLELFLSSTRPGGIGVSDIWVSTRETTADPWSTPVTVGEPINKAGSVSGGPGLSWDGTTLYFSSTRTGSLGGLDVYVSTRRKLRERADDEIGHQR